MVPNLKGRASRTYVEVVTSRPINGRGHGRGKDLGTVEVDRAFVTGNGKGNMYPLPGGHIDDPTVVPTFSPTGPHVQFDTLFGGRTFPEQSKALEAVVGIVTYGYDSCPIRTGIHLVPEGSTEFGSHQAFGRIIEITVCGAKIGLSPDLALIGKARGTHRDPHLASYQVDEIPVKGHIERFPRKGRDIGVGSIDHDLYLVLGDGLVEDAEFVQGTAIGTAATVIKGRPSGPDHQFLTTGPIYGSGHHAFLGFHAIEIDVGLGLGDGDGDMHPFPCGPIEYAPIVPALPGSGPHIEFKDLGFRGAFLEEA